MLTHAYTVYFLFAVVHIVHLNLYTEIHEQYFDICILAELSLIHIHMHAHTQTT